MGYVPHAGARSLSMARANAIGVVLPDLNGEFFSEIVRGMDREATRLGLQLLLSNMYADPARAAQALRSMHGRVDGLLVMCPHRQAIAWAELMPRGLPMLLLNTPDATGAHPAMSIDNRGGAATIARHLIAIGRRRFVHVAGPEHNLDAHDRRTGFEETIRALAPDATLTVLPGDFNEESGEAAAAAIVSSGVAVDAIFAANDMMAVGCVQALRMAGRSIPGDIAVAGFDDLPIARYLDLTTVGTRVKDIGARAVSRLTAIMNGGPAGDRLELYSPELVIRGTTRLTV
jgi:LacI family transcriptional regulator